MASLKRRGKSSFAIIYSYRDETGEEVQSWESYKDELEATQRKSLIDFLQKNGNMDAIRAAALDYKKKREESAPKKEKGGDTKPVVRTPAEMKNITIRELAEIWLPLYAQKIRLKPGTYDGHRGSLDTHIIPYFGDRLVSSLTALDIDQFLEFMSKKKCAGSKSYNKKPEDVPTLSSSSIKKAYDILNLILQSAKSWGCIEEIPKTNAPKVKYKKRKYWTQDTVRYALNNIRNNKLLHLGVHMAFICSMRCGEIMGMPIDAIDFENGCITIKQTLNRVSDEALAKTPQDEIIYVFPKIVMTSKSNLILAKPKTEESVRTVYFNSHLAQELRARLEQIERDKRYMGYTNKDYSDYHLLFAHPNGKPVEPRRMEKWFLSWQVENEIDPIIDVQGLRKSSSMYKLRISNFNYQEVQGDTGHTTPTVLMEHYNEVMDSERKDLAQKVEDSFYEKTEADGEGVPEIPGIDLHDLVDEIQGNPLYAQQLAMLLRNVQLMTQGAQKGV